jgi:hypothetical protein
VDRAVLQIEGPIDEVTEILQMIQQRRYKTGAFAPVSEIKVKSSDPSELMPLAGEYPAFLAHLAAASNRTRLVWYTLASRAGEPVSIDSMGTTLGTSLRQTPGVLGSIGRSVKARKLKTGWEWDRETRTLKLPKEAGDMVLRALKEVGFNA